MSLQALYTDSNCRSAYQLNWSLSVFGKTPIHPGSMNLEELNSALSIDDVRILESHLRAENVAQFFVSSRPEVHPSQIVRAIKGRWVYVARATYPIKLRRNYRITSVGSSRNEILDNYVARQPERHAMADQRVQSLIDSLQFHDGNVNLTQWQRNNHGESIIAYHLVVETESNWNDVRPEALIGYRNAILAAGRKHVWRVARIGLVCNHIHILLGAGADNTPAEIGLSILNNLAFTQDMKAIFKFSYYIGTFGQYDRGAIWNVTKKR